MKVRTGGPHVANLDAPCAYRHTVKAELACFSPRRQDQARDV